MNLHGISWLNSSSQNGSYQYLINRTCMSVLFTHAIMYGFNTHQAFSIRRKSDSIYTWILYSLWIITINVDCLLYNVCRFIICFKACAIQNVPDHRCDRRKQCSSHHPCHRLSHQISPIEVQIPDHWPCSLILAHSALVWIVTVRLCHCVLYHSPQTMGIAASYACAPGKIRSRKTYSKTAAVVESAEM